MKKNIDILQYFTLFVALFFVIMAFDSLSKTMPLMDKILSFLVSILPAILIVLIPIFFRQYYRLSGLLYIGLGIIYFVFFRPYINISQSWPILAMVVTPLLVIGLVYIFYDYKRLS